MTCYCCPCFPSTSLYLCFLSSDLAIQNSQGGGYCNFLYFRFVGFQQYSSFPNHAVSCHDQYKHVLHKKLAVSTHKGRAFSPLKKAKLSPLKSKGCDLTCWVFFTPKRWRECFHKNMTHQCQWPTRTHGLRLAVPLLSHLDGCGRVGIFTLSTWTKHTKM